MKIIKGDIVQWIKNCSSHLIEPEAARLGIPIWENPPLTLIAQTLNREYMQLDSPLQESLQPLIRALFDHKSIEDQPLKFDHNRISRISLNGKKYILKIYGSIYNWLRESLVINYVANLGIDFVHPPKLVGCIKQEAKWIGYALFNQLEGVHISESLKCSKEVVSLLYYKLGEWTARFHALAPHTLGTRVFSLRSNSMFGILPLLDFQGFTTFEVQFDRLTNHLLKKLQDSGNYLIHNDLGLSSNVLIQGNSVQAVIDFEFSHFGFRATDLLWIYLESDLYFEDFMHGYGASTSRELQDLLYIWSTLYAVIESTGYDWREHLFPYHLPTQPQFALHQSRTSTLWENCKKTVNHYFLKYSI